VLIIAPIALMDRDFRIPSTSSRPIRDIVMNAAGFFAVPAIPPVPYATIVVRSWWLSSSHTYPCARRHAPHQQWDAEITADVLTNILQPGRFAQLDRISHPHPRAATRRRGWSHLCRRPPAIPKSGSASSPMHGTVLRTTRARSWSLRMETSNFEVGKRDPAMVAFGRYAFACPSSSNIGSRRGVGIRERYLWELVSAGARRSHLSAIPGQFRARMHDRFMAPISFASQL